MAIGTREVRLGLVLNGGVSLAIWIGGVTRELDAARRAAASGTEDDGTDTLPLYRKILAALHEEVVVDVIAGASAGGINGVLLGAAIFNGKPLGNLRETWIGLGDFRTLLRSPSYPNPPSLMQGDQIVLPELRRTLAQLYEGHAEGPTDQSLYVYVTATDLFGYPAEFADTSGRTFEERDNRRVFRFEHDGTTEPVPDDRKGVMRQRVRLGDPDAVELLARAARSSSSFPVAFEAHALDIVDRERDGERVRRHWLVDGGILDNQPFTPVLDRIAVLPAARPVKRVVMYVVPYVTEVGSGTSAAPAFASARDTLGAASSLPRNVPKLLSLRRIAKDYEELKTADEARRRLRDVLDPATLAAAAATLFPSYRETRAAAADAVWRLWASPYFRPGDGTVAQDPSVDARAVAPPPPPVLPDAEVAAEETPSPLWLPAQREWSPDDERWSWGLGPAERIAIWALAFLRDVEASEQVLQPPRTRASRLVTTVRAAKVALESAFEATDPAYAPDERARLAYTEIGDRLETIQSEFAFLDGEIAAVTGSPPPLRVQALLDYEVTRNAVHVQDEQLSLPFEFVFASAGIPNSLGHRAATPAEKLAGMKLGHFAGFLKRSWRANDWLWGRLDGVEHVLRAVLDAERLARLPAAATELADVAFGPPPLPANLAEERAVLVEMWRANARACELVEFASGDPAQRFVDATVEAAATRVSDPDRSAACLELCRRALAARLQLRVLGEDLTRVAETASDDLQAGSSRVANGAFWAGRLFHRDRNARRREGRELGVRDRLDLFRELDVGGETVEDETSSRLAMDVGSQLVAVAAATFAGDRGGLPAAARGALATVRGLSLATSRLLRLLAQIPWFGAVVFAVLVTLLIVAVEVDGALLGTLVPALAVLAVVTGVALLTLVTSIFEHSLTTLPKLLGYAVFLGVPLGFALTVGGPPLVTEWASELEDTVGAIATDVAVWAAFAAAGAAALRVLGAPVDLAIAKWRKRPRSFAWRRALLTGYRIAVAASLASLAVGFVLERARDYRGEDGATGWAAVANERLGAVLVTLLIAVLLAAALIQELSAESRLRRALQWFEGR